MVTTIIIKLQKYCLILLLFLGFLDGFAQEVVFPFADEISKFKENDRINPPPQHAILFLGSSSFRMWYDVQDHFKRYTIINRGFGGSTLIDVIHYADDIVFPYSPKQIVIYCGENDLASGNSITSDTVTERFINLFNLIRSTLPDVRITYVSMKPSPSRWALAEEFVEGNQNIREFIESQSNASFVNIWDAMLDRHHLPDNRLFMKDMLHMNEKGYRIWEKAIKPELIH